MVKVWCRGREVDSLSKLAQGLLTLMLRNTTACCANLTSDKSAKRHLFVCFFDLLSPSLMSWSHPNLKFVFSGLSDLVPYFYSNGGRECSQHPSFSNPTPLLPLCCLTLPCFYPSTSLAKPMTSQCSSLSDR